MRFQSTAALFALVAIEAATAVPVGWPIPVVEDEVAANPSAISAAPESLYTFPAAKAPKDRVPDISLTPEQLKEIVDLLRAAAAPREVAAVDPSAAAAPNAAAPNAAAPNAAAPNAAAPSAAAGEVAAAPGEVAAAPGEVAAAPSADAVANFEVPWMEIINGIGERQVNTPAPEELDAERRYLPITKRQFLPVPAPLWGPGASDEDIAAIARSLYDDSNAVVELPTGDLTAAAPVVSKRQSINGVPIIVEDAAAAVSKRQSINGVPIPVEDAVALAKRQTAPAALYYYGQPALSKREIVSQPIPRDIDALNFGKRYINPETVSAVLPDENVTAAAPVVGNPDENVTAAAPVVGNPDETVTAAAPVLGNPAEIFVAEITYDGFDGPVKRQTADAFADRGKRQPESPAAAPAVEEVPFGAEALAA